MVEDGYAVNYINGILIYLKAVYHFAETRPVGINKDGSRIRLTYNPTVGIPPVDGGNVDDFLLTYPMYLTCRDACMGDFKGYWTACWETGRRPKEVALLRCGQVKMDCREIHWTAANAKKSIDSITSMSGELYAVLSKIDQSNPDAYVFANRLGNPWLSCRKQLYHIRAESKIHLPSIRVTRRGRITYLAEVKGWPKEDIMAFVGLRTPSVFDRYHIRSKSKVEAIANAVDFNEYQQKRAVGW